jgi:ABC-type multidrug transport system fused ATPase/permease subunit
LKIAFQEKHKSGYKRPLVSAIFQTFKTDIVVGGLASLVSTVTQVLIPFVVKYIIMFAAEAYYAEQLGGSGPLISHGVGLVIGMTLMQLIGGFASNHFFYRGMITGGQVRSALISIIFDKSMTISGRAKAGGSKKLEPLPPDVKPGSEEEKKHFRDQIDISSVDSVTEEAESWNNGRIVNLMSVDTYRIDQGFGWLHMVWTSPITLIVTIILLLINITYSAMVGIGVFLLSVPIMGVGVSLMFKRRKMINKLTDDRVSMTQEVLHAIRFIKYYSWEADFKSRLGDIRQKEIRSIRVLLTLRNIINSIGAMVPVFAAMLAFITFSLTNHSLDPAAIFSSLALFNQLRLPLVLLPMVLGMVSDAMQSISRIEDFLLAEDSVSHDPKDDGGDYALNITSATFTWEQSTPPDPNEVLRKGDPSRMELKEAGDKKKAKKSSQKKAKQDKEDPSRTSPAEPRPFKIENIDLTVGRGELIAIIGGVGSGKSSLLSAIAGEMRRTSGSSILNGKTSFCTQLPWIQNATVRENITFGRPLDEARYEQIVEACSLGHDLRVLPHGSNTEIGERGINLSGGQKHRVSLARAIYFDTDIVLLDDPLAAVDAHVGAHIMDHAICRLLKNKCRILATHQLQYLPRCDRIIIMQNGKLEAYDTYQNLMKYNISFQELMAKESIAQNIKNMDEDSETLEANNFRREATKSESQDSLMQEEERATHSVSWSVYSTYWRSTGSYLVLPLILFTLILSQGANVVTNLWLAWWLDDQFHLPTASYVSSISSSDMSYN